MWSPRRTRTCWSPSFSSKSSMASRNVIDAMHRRSASDTTLSSLGMLDKIPATAVGSGGCSSARFDFCLSLVKPGPHDAIGPRPCIWCRAAAVAGHKIQAPKKRWARCSPFVAHTKPSWNLGVRVEIRPQGTLASKPHNFAYHASRRPLYLCVKTVKTNVTWPPTPWARIFLARRWPEVEMLHRRS